MSWTYLKLSRNNQSNVSDLKLENSLFNLSDNNLIIQSGGNPETCIYYYNCQDKTGFIVLGIIIDKVEGILNFQEIEKFKRKIEHFNPKDFDGHFVVIKWDISRVEIYTDILGLRDIYLYCNSTEIILTTNPLYLKQHVKLEIDFNIFASKWLLFNQISTRSIFKNIERIVAGKSLIINRNTLEIKERKYEFEPQFDSRSSIKDFDFSLQNLINLPFSQNKNLSLSLSGGFDSRLLLSNLLKTKNETWSVHTFGDINHPDRIIAEQIISTYDLKAEIINRELPNQDELIKALSLYCSDTMASNPSSDIVQLLNYKSLTNKYDVILDGGFGEIWRRQFLNRLNYFGKKAMQEKNIKEIKNLLKLFKADIFIKDVNNEIEFGTLQQIEEIFYTLPEFSKIGLANWLDLLSIKTRLPNLYSQEQTRLDASFFCFMPYAQLSLLNHLFLMDMKLRKNSKLFRKLIATHKNRLNKIPLAKNNVIYPFKTSSIILAMITKINQKTRSINDEDMKINFFKTLSEYIGDIINSKEVQKYEQYDYKKIITIYDNYRKNPNQYWKELDWFLSFEILRQNML